MTEYTIPTCPECSSTFVTDEDDGVRYFHCESCGYSSTEDEDCWIKVKK